MPTSLTPEQIKEYSEKWLKGTITIEEKNAFEEWYNEQLPDAIMWDTAENEAQLRERIYDKVSDNIRVENIMKRKSWNRRTWLMAASVIFIIFFAALAFFSKKGHKEEIITDTKLRKPVSEKSVTYTRSITLQDGSTVVLRANSNLNYPTKFIGETREVTLTGEAFFDVKPGSKPFIIHTGDVKTVVLGTAFNIKAYPDSKDVTISVIRGKVRVENQKKILSILTPDQQITCRNAVAESSQPLKVDAASIIADWTRQDMVFEDVSFQTVADLLSRRYNVSINFKNAALAKCNIKAFFNGTESLNKVLESLCLISNSVYTRISDDKIILDGEGCE
ncbi:MAG: FecR domain-containing protein [Bacteroidetes bacterium]|nr:FecR domain-containing protein [Bacteroidota bacterium]